MPEISPSLYRAGHGEPLVLLHGFMGTWHHWRPVIAELVPRYEVIAPTLSGHDGGPPFTKTGALRIADAADSLEEHLDELGVGTAHLVGNSMGGGLAIELAKRGRARSVVALAPGGGWRPESGEHERLVRFFVRTNRMARASASRLPMVMRRPRMRRLALRDVMWRGELVAPVDAVHVVRSSLRCSIFDLVLQALRTNGAMLEDLDQVAAPTLIAWPQHDRVLPMALHSDRFRAEIPGVEFRVLPAVGHVPMWDDPRLVVETIHGFVSRHAGTGAGSGAARAPAAA
ncbi:MAG: alpha/beta fold hydrolase [Solirubrobacterales bacterium]|nr:alpha/beta fold hydrolase [Solirubrobacterales bacterium]